MAAFRDGFRCGVSMVGVACVVHRSGPGIRVIMVGAGLRNEMEFDIARYSFRGRSWGGRVFGFPSKFSREEE